MRERYETDNVQPVRGDVRCGEQPARADSGAPRAPRRGARAIPHLTATEEVLYTVLVKAGGAVMTPTELLTWVGYENGSGHVLDAQTLRAHICNLRRKLPWQEAARIKTAWSRGYYYGEFDLPRPALEREPLAPLPEVAPAAWTWVDAQRVAR